MILQGGPAIPDPLLGKGFLSIKVNSLRSQIIVSNMIYPLFKSELEIKVKNLQSQCDRWGRVLLYVRKIYLFLLRLSMVRFIQHSSCTAAKKKHHNPIKTTYRYELLLTQSYRPCPFREESHPLSNWCVCVCITYSYKNMPVADSNDNKNQEENCNILKWTWIGESAQRQERLDLNNAQNDFKIMVIKTSKNRH